MSKQWAGAGKQAAVGAGGATGIDPRQRIASDFNGDAADFAQHADGGFSVQKDLCDAGEHVQRAVLAGDLAARAFAFGDVVSDAQHTDQPAIWCSHRRF